MLKKNKWFLGDLPANDKTLLLCILFMGIKWQNWRKKNKKREQKHEETNLHEDSSFKLLEISQNTASFTIIKRENHKMEKL